MSCCNSLGDKYQMSGCGCGCNTTNTRTFYGTGCCNNSIQPSPSPCCEAHNTICRNGNCLYTTADIVTTDSHFFMSFSNVCDESLPINTNEIFFYHPTAGFIRVITMTSSVVNNVTIYTYEVELVDDTKAGTEIKTTDCVLLTVQQSVGGVVPAISRCLSGNFTAPALNADGTIYILNGSGIPIGSTITFTANGETGSYLIKAFISASNNIYAYTVTNTGAGHTPGTIINGGCDGVCLIPIEIITEIDVCDLSETQVIDSLVGCLNGSPRAFKPSGEGDIPYGTAGRTWELRKLTNLDCCVITEGCLKFSSDDYPIGSDQVVIQNFNLDCFTEALDFAQSNDNNLAMNIDGFNVVITNYDAGTRTITVEYAGTEPLTELIEFPAGTQICLGSCCDSCVENAPHNTNVQTATEGEDSSLSGFNLLAAELIYPTGISHWLCGLDYVTGQYAFIECDAAYFANPDPGFLGLPRITDPMLFRHKICNDSQTGCDQLCKVTYNFWLALHPMTANTRVHWEFGHYCAESATLADGTTPNPFFNIATQRKESGILQGPATVLNDLQTSSFGAGNAGNIKVIPYNCGGLEDFIILRKNDCAMSIFWLFLTIETSEQDGGAFNTVCTVRRQIEKKDWYGIPYPNNAKNSEGFNV